MFTPFSPLVAGIFQAIHMHGESIMGLDYLMYQSDRSIALVTALQLTSTKGQLIPYESEESYQIMTDLGSQSTPLK